MQQICVNTPSIGITNDPRVAYDSDSCEQYQYKFVEDLIGDGTIILPMVCGNCSHFSVQELKRND